MMMWCYDNLVFIIGLFTALAYAFTIYKYSLKRRKLEKTLGIINLIMPFIALIYYYYPVFTLNFQYEHVFQYLYPEATLAEKFTSVFYSAPSLYVLLLTVLIGYSIRFKWGGFLGRPPFRRILYGVTMVTAALYSILAYPGLINKFSVLPNTGSGVYPLQTNPIVFIQIILVVAIVSLLLIGGSIFIGLWEKKVSFLWALGERLYDVSMVLTILLFLIRIYYNNIFLSRMSFMDWSIIDIMVGGLLVSQLFAKDSIQLSRNRVLGVLPFSNYFTVVYSILFLFHITPKIVLGLENAVYIPTLASALIIPAFFTAFPVGSRIFKRSFYPWMSEEPRYFIRVSTSSIYVIIIIAIIYLSTTLSIYFSAGKYVHPSESYTWSLLIFFLISLVISPIIQVLMKWTKNFYIFYGILFLLVFLLIGGQTYKLYDFRTLTFVTIGIGIIALLIVLIRRRLKDFSLYNVYIIFFLVFLIVFFSANMYSEKGVVNDIVSDKSMAAYGVDIKYVSYKTFNSSTQVMGENLESETTYPMYRMLELNLGVGSRNIQLFRIDYPSKNIILSKGSLYPYDSYTLKLLISRYVAGQTPKIDVSVYRYNWFYYNYYIWPILLSIAILLYNKDEALEKEG